MASYRIIDKGTTKQRYKVEYEVKTLDGKRKRRSKTFPGYTPMKDVRTFMRKKETEYAESDGVLVTDMRLQVFFEEVFVPTFRDTLSLSTTQGYRSCFYAEGSGVLSFFGNVKLEDITTRRCQEYSNWLRSEGYSPKTVKNRIMFLHTLLEKAIQLQYLQKGINPSSKVVIPKMIKKPVEAYTAEELQKMLELVDQEGDQILKMIVYIAIGTGMRRSEIAGLKVEDIDTDEGCIHVSRAVIYAEESVRLIKDTKTESGRRDVYCPDKVLDVLKEGIKRYKKHKLSGGRQFTDDGFILCYDDGVPIGAVSIGQRYTRFVKRHSDQIRYLSLHKLRHSYTSLCMANGADIKALQESLGHASASMTMDIYGHAYREKKKEQAETLGEQLFTKIG